MYLHEFSRNFSNFEYEKRYSRLKFRKNVTFWDQFGMVALQDGASQIKAPRNSDSPYKLCEARSLLSEGVIARSALLFVRTK